jgi:hypothetical protein
MRIRGQLVRLKTILSHNNNDSDANGGNRLEYQVQGGENEKRFAVSRTRLALPSNGRV